MAEKPRRRFGFLRDAAVSTGVALAVWAGFEATLRVAQPQVSRTEEKDGLARAVEDSVLGHRYRPGTRAVQRTPEFTAEYAIGEDGRRVGTQHPDSLGVITIDLSISFVGGASGARLFADARVLRDGRSMSFVEAEAKNEDGSLVAKAIATVRVRLKEKGDSS